MALGSSPKRGLGGVRDPVQDAGGTPLTAEPDGTASEVCLFGRFKRVLRPEVQQAGVISLSKTADAKAVLDKSDPKQVP